MIKHKPHLDKKLSWNEIPHLQISRPHPTAVVQNKRNSYIPSTTSERLRVPLSLDHYPLQQILFLL